jgi:diguanylate cyclase (GGDEF)-like protein
MMETAPDMLARPIRQFVMALCLYLLWCGLAWTSDFLGYTSLPRESATVVVAGILATVFLFLFVTCTKVIHQPPKSTIALAHCVFGITWATLYTFLGTGSGELVPGMYITVFLFAVSNLRSSLLPPIAVFSAVSYSFVLLAKWLLNPITTYFWPDSIGFGLYIGFTGWLLFLNRGSPSLKHHEPTFEASLQAMANEIDEAEDRNYFTNSFNQRYIMDSLVREKGWTDRSNNPFSICILDIDSFSELGEHNGAAVCDRILREFSQCVRSALRAMDTVNPTGIGRTLGQFSNEEYVAIFPHTNLRGARRCAERIREAVSSRVFDSECHLTVSAGVAEYQRGETIGDLLARAEKSLDTAVDAGGDQVRSDADKPQGNAEIIELHNLNS